MNREQLFEGIGGLDEALLVRSEGRAQSRESKQLKWDGKTGRKKRLRRWLTVAACVALVILGAAEVIDRMDYLRMGCSAWAGTLVDGVYYYNVSHSGVWCYTPQDGSRRVVSAWEEDGWQANAYGIYYTQGRSLYVREHESGKKRRLYKAGLFESTDIGFSMQTDGNVVVRVYNKRKDTVYELLLDGVTGNVLEEVTEKVSYSEKGLLYSEAHFQVGDRQLTLVKEEGKDGYDLLENGESLLPEDRRLESSNRIRYYGNTLFWPLCQEEDAVPSEYLVVRPDGSDSIFESGNRSFLTGTDDFLFYLIGNTSTVNSLWCMEIATGECWRVQKNHEITIYDMETDGEWMFTCVPWSEEQVCWRLGYDESGRPTTLELVSEDIAAR